MAALVTVLTFAAIVRKMEVRPAFTEPASTDHNVPLARGVSGVCLAITEGANEHRPEEYIETGPIPTAVKNIVLAAVELTTGK